MKQCALAEFFSFAWREDTHYTQSNTASTSLTVKKLKWILHSAHHSASRCLSTLKAHSRKVTHGTLVAFCSWNSYFLLSFSREQRALKPCGSALRHWGHISGVWGWLQQPPRGTAWLIELTYLWQCWQLLGMCVWGYLWVCVKSLCTSEGMRVLMYLCVLTCVQTSLY